MYINNHWMILYINVYFVCMDEKSRWPVWQEIFNIGPYGYSLVRVSKSTCAHGPLTNLVVFFCFRIFSEIMKLIEPKLYINDHHMSDTGLGEPMVYHYQDMNDTEFGEPMVYHYQDINCNYYFFQSNS